MPIIKVTKADLLKTKNLTPGWYSFEVVKVYEPKGAKNSNTINYVFDCRILEGQEGAGKEIPARFNSSLIGAIAPFYYALTGIEVDENTDLDLGGLIGKKADGKVVPSTYEGNVYDNFEAFVPYGRGKEAGNMPF